MTDIKGKRILLGLSGGIAAYKAAELTRLLTQAGAEVQVVMTAAACRFITPVTHAGAVREIRSTATCGMRACPITWRTSSFRADAMPS